jgi:hypothetical protein
MTAQKTLKFPDTPALSPDAIDLIKRYAHACTSLRVRLRLSLCTFEYLCLCSRACVHTLAFVRVRARLFLCECVRAYMRPYRHSSSACV